MEGTFFGLVNLKSAISYGSNDIIVFGLPILEHFNIDLDKGVVRVADRERKMKLLSFGANSTIQDRE